MRKTLVAALVAAFVVAGCTDITSPSRPAAHAAKVSKVSGFTISAGRCTRDSDGSEVAMSYCDGGNGSNRLSPNSASISKTSGFTITAGNKCVRDSDGEEVALSYCEPE